VNDDSAGSPEGGDEFDLEVPPPGPLKDYVKVLDAWTKDEPCGTPWLDGLLGARDFGEREKREWGQGRQGIWKLIPPITQAEIEEAELEPRTLLALGLAVVVQGRHGMAALDPEAGSQPESLRTIEKLARYLSEQLEAAGRRSAHGGIARLAALRQDLQERRRSMSRREEGLTADATLDAERGIASARIAGRQSLGARLMGRLRRITEPGMAKLRAATTPGKKVEGGEEPEWDTDPQVPQPLGLYHYVTSLDLWLAERAMDEPFLDGLVRILGFGSHDKEAFRRGRSKLWGLVPPIDAEQVASADLDVDAARALSVAVVFWARHLLAWYRPEQSAGVPPEILEAGDMVSALRLILSDAKGATPVGDRLYGLGLDLEARGAVSVSALADRRAAIIEDHHARIDERRLREMEAFEKARRARLKELDKGRKISMTRLIIGGTILATLIGVWLLQPDEEYLPPARSYGELPAVAIIRHADKITIRVDRSWLQLPKEQREGQMSQLWDRFGREMEREDDPVDLSVVSKRSEPLGGFKLGFAWWDPSVEPEPEPEPPPEEEAPG